MNISWVFGDDVKIAYQKDLWTIKSVGPTWGSWRGWRYTNTDNVVCADPVKAQELLGTRFYQNCNLYLPDSFRRDTEWPREVRVFGGEFPVEVDRKEEAISLYLAGSISDIVLLYGWHLDAASWQARDEYSRGFILHTLETLSVQWVVVDHPGELDPEIRDLPNLSQDTLAQVAALMKI